MANVVMPDEVINIINGDGGFIIDDNINRFYHNRAEDTSLTTSAYDGALWKCDVSFIPADNTEHRIWNAWLDDLRGSMGYTMFPVKQAKFLQHTTEFMSDTISVVGEWDTFATSLMVTSPVAVTVPTWSPFNIMQDGNRKLHFTTRHINILSNTPTLLHFSHGLTQGNNAITNTAYSLTANDSVGLNFNTPLLSMRMSVAASSATTRPTTQLLDALTFVEEV